MAKQGNRDVIFPGPWSDSKSSKFVAVNDINWRLIVDFYNHLPCLLEPSSREALGLRGMDEVDNVSCTFQFLLTIGVCSGQDRNFVPHLDEALAEVSALPLKASESVMKGRPCQH